MPASVANASATTVLPAFLCRSFSHSRSYVVSQNEYCDGQRQSRLLTSSSNKSWSLTAAVTPSVLSALQTFYLARKGPTEAFYFYDLTVTGAVHDPTGALTTGRHTVHFASDYSQRLQLGTCEADFTLVELA